MTVTSRPRLALFVLLGVLALAALGVAPAMAANPCDQTVVDGAGLFKGDTSAIEAGAQKLAQLGADVRVVTIDTIGSAPTLDNYITSLQKNCSSWLGSDGQRKNNLLVFAVGVNPKHTQGIFYGDRWVPAFDNGQDLRIQSDDMGPQFRNGNFANGIADGMKESYRIMNAYLHPKSGASGPTTIVNKKPANLSWLWVLLGVLVAIGACVLAYAAIRRRRQEIEAREAARQRALSNRDAATQILDAIGDEDSNEETVRRAKVAKFSAAGPDVAHQLEGLMADLQGDRATAQDGMASAASASATAEDKGLATPVYEEMEARYAAVLEHAQAAQAANQRLDGICDDLESRFAAMPQDIAAVQASLDSLAVSLKQLRVEGIHTYTVDALVASTADELGKAQASPDLSGLAHLSTAKSGITDANSELTSLSEKRQQLHDGIPALNARIDQAKVMVVDGKACFDRIEATYVESSWKAVSGNGSEAEKRIQAAEQAMNEATRLSDSSVQDWDGALAVLQQGNGQLDKSASLITSITKLEKHLQTAQANAPAEIAAAKADIDQAREYLGAYDDDIRDELERDLDTAHDLLLQASSELAKPMPDYLVVIKLATKANSAADQIYAEAVDEHEAAERLRRQAESTLSQAQAAVSQAREYIQDHDSDVGSSAESYLRDAQGDLQVAEAANVPQDVLAHSQSALEAANQAYSSAENDFEDAERRRRRRREEEQAALSASYTHHSSGGGFDSFGGSSGSFGGGSSSSWGGGGGGGGSSSSW